MNILSSIQTFFRLPDLRKKFFILIGLLAVARLVSAIPIPGVDRAQLSQFLNTNSAFSLLNIFNRWGTG
jgi:preprotein translocase subunit SecY